MLTQQFFEAFYHDLRDHFDLIEIFFYFLFVMFLQHQINLCQYDMNLIKLNIINIIIIDIDQQLLV